MRDSGTASARDILYLSRPIVPPWDSGSKNVPATLARHLSRYRIHLTAGPGGEAGWPGHVVPERIYSSARFDFPQKLHLFYRLFRDRPRVDLYHFFFHPTRLTSTIVRLMLRGRRQPVILTNTHAFKSAAVLKRQVFGDVIVCYSRSLAGTLKRAGVADVAVIRPPVDLARFHPGVQVAGLAERLGIAGHPTVLYAGYFNPAADLNSLLEAVAYCSCRVRGVRFVLACRLLTASDRAIRNRFVDQLKQRGLHDSAVILDVVADMPEMIGLCDVSILPLNSTLGKVDLPLVLLESMAECKPIVITQIEPLCELMEWEVGASVPVGRGGLLGEAIESLLLNPERRREAGERGRAWVEENCSPERIARQYERLYEEWLEKR